jgi:hypothetical protein
VTTSGGPQIKRLIMLANSRKTSGRCLAGKQVDSGEWIRPISARPSHEVSEEERQYEDGGDPQVMDVVDVPLIGPRPHGYQSENWLLDDGFYWERHGKLRAADLESLVDQPGSLWRNGSSTQAGLNDRVPSADAAGLTESLLLIEVPGGTLKVHAPGAAFGNSKRRVQLAFEYGGEPYALRVTDPMIEREYFAKRDGDYSLGEAFLVISLGEPYGGYAYKLVATIISKASR